MNGLSTRFRSDCAALLVLALGIALLFLPTAAGWLGIFQDDQAMAEFPWHYFLAVHFQNGEIPLWEPNTWCGAIPFYARYYADTYYAPLWPFYLLARPGDLGQSYWLLSLLPLFLHYLLAGVGMYVFLRRTVRLHPLSSLAGGWIYVFSPAFSYSYVWFPIVAVQAWLPWLLMQVAGMDRRPSWSRVAWGGVILALMSLAAQPPHLGYSLVVAAFLALALFARRFMRGEYALSFRAPLLLSAAVILGGCLSAVYWFSTLEGQFHTEQHIDLSYDSVAGKDGSLPPLYLATLFSPELFGSVNGLRLWGGDISYEARYWEANLSGGILLLFLAWSGLRPLLRFAGTRRLRFWSLLSLAILVFSLLCVLGRHTPFYRLIFRAVPFLSQFPFPIRYRFLECLAVSWLAGLGVEVLFSRRSPSPWPAREVWGYLAIAGVLIGLALLWPQALTSQRISFQLPPRTPWAFPGVREVIERREDGWFVLQPLAGAVLEAAALVLVWRGLRGRTRAAAATALAMVSVALTVFSGFYFCTFSRRYPRPEHFRSVRPGTHPMVVRVLDRFSPLRRSPDLRWATDQPFHDNFARLNASTALMGYDMKPLERRFKRAVEAAYQKPMDWPIYWDNPRAAFVPFLSHFSVGDLMDVNPRSPFVSGRTVKLDRAPPVFLHENTKALPRVYAQDRIAEASSDEQMRELVGGDLRRGVLMVEVPPDAGRAEGVSVARYREAGNWYESTAPEEEAARFRELQERNAVLRVDRSRANAVVAECDFRSPAMLVFTDVWYPGWRSAVDGRPAELYRVNYCQRGVWLTKGRHRVELRFAPTLWAWGAAVSLVSWAGLIVASVAVALRGTPGARLGRRSL